MTKEESVNISRESLIKLLRDVFIHNPTMSFVEMIIYTKTYLALEVIHKINTIEIPTNDIIEVNLKELGIGAK